jgi:hypothetical protein
MNRNSLPFRQRIGEVPVPTQLKTNDVSIQLRARIRSVLDDYFQEYTVYAFEPYIKEVGLKFWKHYCLHYANVPTDKVESNSARVWQKIVALLETKQVSLFYELIEAFVRFHWENNHPVAASENVKDALIDCRAGWRFETIDNLPTLVPVSSQLEAQALSTDLLTISDAKIPTVQEHLRLAAECLSGGKWAESIKNSANSVEATARKIVNNQSATLSSALKDLKNLAPAISSAIEKIYVYSSDESGVRHSLKEGRSDPTELEAIFMFHTCISICAYLIGKSKTA